MLNCLYAIVFAVVTTRLNTDEHQVCESIDHGNMDSDRTKRGCMQFTVASDKNLEIDADWIMDYYFSDGEAASRSDL